MSVPAYLWFPLASEADLEAFHRDLRAVRELAARQPGHRWTASPGRHP